MNWFYQVTGYKKGERPLIRAFILVTILFFFWAFVHNINGILMPHFRSVFRLSDLQSALVDFSVYISYFLCALPAGWLMRKKGYRAGMIAGLLLFIAGALLFIPSALLLSYPLFLCSLFIIAGGAACLETVANPYITVLGPADTATQRLNFAQAFNGIGAVVTPLIGTALILKNNDAATAAGSLRTSTVLHDEAKKVILPYLLLAGLVLVLLLLFLSKNRIPEAKKSLPDDQPELANRFLVFRHQHFLNALLTQFCYVGAQVCISSYFIRFAEHTAQMSNSRAGYLLGSVAMVGFMIGRFTGTFFMRFMTPQKLLALYSGLAIALLVLSIHTSGAAAVYLLCAVPFFLSIMFPTIFALGLQNMGQEVKMASPLLIMSIIGGGIFPLLMGYISDQLHNIQLSFYVPAACLLVVWWFARYGYKPKTEVI